MHPSEVLPRAIYDGRTLSTTPGIPQATLANARRSGTLRYTRQGSRFVYLGQWVLDWIESESKQDVTPK